MRLYISAASPFARKCRIVARECGVELEEIGVDVMALDPRLVAANPIAQVPALEIEDGTMFIDSPLICAYLDGFSGAPKLLPPPPSAGHWRASRTESIADAGLEMAVKVVLEKRRPQGEQSQSWIDRWNGGLLRALAAAEAEVRPPEPLDIGLIALGCVGAYVDLRRPDLDWRPDYPRLAAFCEDMETRESFRATRPG